jgi:alkanesulfonate monooxygenase SsuD/methylene tetrahydromethanopterin reductase-like flavin-dependent oxidoreductase (luciferase family)
VTGTPEQVAERILEYRNILGGEGTYVARAHFPGLDPSVAAESRRILSEEVLPLVTGAA